MDPAAPATAQALRLVSEIELNALGWTHNAKKQVWVFHGSEIPDLAKAPASIGQVLFKMWGRLGHSMRNIEDSMRAVGVEVPVPYKPTDFSTPAQPAPGTNAPKDLHEILDAVVDAAKKQGARVQITVDPTDRGGFNPVKFMEIMLQGQCPSCGGHHG